MDSFPHHVRRQSLTIATESETEALALQARIGDINRQQFLPAIERVFEELALPGRAVRIGHLDVNLGTMTPGELAAEGGERLERALRRALEEILRGYVFYGGNLQRTETEQELRLQRFQSWLMSGTLPIWAPQSFNRSLESFFLELARESAASLAEVIRRAGTREHVRERLVLQLGVSGFQRLLHLLEPQHAELIFGYLVDLGEIHRANPIVPLEEKKFTYQLRLFTLAYLLREPGSQFNRKSFASMLLTEMAAHQSLNYQDLLIAVRLGVEKTQNRTPLSSSLPAVLKEITHDLSLTEPEEPAEATPADLERYWSGEHSQPGFPARVELESLFESLVERDPAALVRLIRRRGLRRGVLERLVLDLPVRLLARLIHLLEPQHAVLILEYIADLEAIHRIEPVLPIGDRRFSRLIWLLTLAYVIRDADSQFNRKAFVESLLREMENSEAISAADLMETLRRGLLRTERRGPLKSSLVAVLRAIVWEHETRRKQAEDAETERIYRSLEGVLLRGADRFGERELAMLVALARSSPESLRRLLRSTQSVGSPGVNELIGKLCAGASTRNESTSTAFREALREVSSFAVAGAGSFGAYDAVEALRFLLSFGFLPWFAINRSPSLTPGVAMGSLLAMPLSQIMAVFEATSREEMLKRIFIALRPLDTDTQQLLLQRLLPGQSAAAPIWASLEEHASAPESRASILARVMAAIVDKQPIDLEAIAAEEPLQPAACDPPKMADREQVKSLFAAALRGDITGLPFAGLLKKVLALPGPEVHGFLRAMGRDRVYRSALARRSTAAQFKGIVQVLFAQQAEPILALYEAILPLPRSRRPSGQEVREAIIEKTSVAGILARLFPDAVPEELQSFQRTKRRRRKVMPAGHEDAQAQDELELLRFLSGKDTALRQLDLRQAFESAAGNPSGELHAMLAAQIADEAARERWIAAMPESALARIAWTVNPRRHQLLMDSAEILQSAMLRAAPGTYSTLTGRKEFWRFLLTFLALHTDAATSVDRLTVFFFEYFSARLRRIEPGAQAHQAVGESLLAEAARLARQGGRPALVEALQRKGEILAAWREPRSLERRTGASAEAARSSRPRPVKGHTAFGMNGLPEKAEDAVFYIGNAGLVLTAPFLPRFFERLQMTATTDGTIAWKSPEMADRAVHLLQWLVTGRTSTPEPALLLNKILCGLDLAVPVGPGIEISETEIEIADQLLQAILANWKIVSQSSVAALRETFLRREGKLERSDNGYKLRVHRKTVDVLVDQIPWSIAVIRTPWMAEPLYVTW